MIKREILINDDDDDDDGDNDDGGDDDNEKNTSIPYTLASHGARLCSTK